MKANQVASLIKASFCLLFLLTMVASALGF